MTLNYKSFGQGQPIVILHGLFGTLDNWQTIAKKLAEQYMVFIIDLRNHGKSPHDPEMNYSIMAEDIQHFLESQWIYESHIIGHSMGGKVAMEFAHQYPEMVEKLVVVDIAPKAYPPGHQRIFEALFKIDLKEITNRKEADNQLQPRIEEFSVRQFLLKNLTREKDGNYRWKMNLPVIFKHYPEILASVELEEPFAGDTLFVRGGQSNYITDEDYPLIEAQFPNAVIETIPESGHWVHAEAPATFLQILEGFLNQ